MLEASHVLGVVDEIQARSHDFFEKNVLTLHEEDLRNALEDGLPAGAGSLEEFGHAVRRAWESRGVRYEWGESSDPVARELLRSISDSVRSELPPGVGHPEALDLAALLRSEYAEIVAPSGAVRGFIRRGGSRPLLVLNALGLSIKIWSRLLSGEHDYRVIVPVLPSCDPLAGGMTETQSARELASTLADLLDDLALPEVDVIGWCNAGRVGIELFRLSHPSLAKLVLLSPTFRGGLTRSGGTSPWEDNLDKLFSMVADVPSRAAYVSTMMRLPQPAPDWEQLADQPIQRVRQLFSMPRKAFDTALIKPMATPESLVHYVRRTYLDQALSAEPPAPLPGDRIVLIQGSHDSIVDNVHTREWLGDRAPGFTCYEVSGAGHYIQDLQYPYLVYLLHRVLVPGSEVGCLPTRVREISQACP
jgi:pimeloyl-ACP methyl ester carboxylesterase